MFRLGIMVGVVCGILALAAVLALPRVANQKPLNEHQLSDTN